MGNVVLVGVDNDITLYKSATINANNTTASISLFRVTGSVLVKALYGIVTVGLSANHTAAHWRLSDGTNTPAITLATGTTLSSAGVGSKIVRSALSTSALALQQSDQVRLLDPSSTPSPTFVSFQVTQKNATNSDIEYRYTTTDAPASGEVLFRLVYTPVSTDGSVAVV